MFRRIAKWISRAILVGPILMSSSSCNVGTPAPPPVPPPVEASFPPLYELRVDLTPEVIRTAKPIDLCDLIAQRSAHDGDVVRVVGLFLVGLEHADLTAERCYNQEPICVWFHRTEEFSPTVVMDRFNDLKTAFGRKVAVVGEFHSSDSGYCHLGSRSTELIVFALESVEAWQGRQQ
jgi:hypothetical protein